MGRFFWLSRNLQLNTLVKLLTILDSRLRGNDTFFLSVPSFPVIPAKAGIQELIDTLSIVDKQKKFLSTIHDVILQLLAFFFKRQGVLKWD
jgi:hypothetical protein